MELPDADRRLGLRARAGRGQHRGAQAGRAHAAHRDPDRRAGAGGRAAASTCSRCCRARARWSVQRFVDPPAGPQGRLHRLHRGRQADHGRLRRPGEAGDARARRQERQHRLRRRRPRRRRPPPRRTPSSTTPARTAAPGRGSWSSGRRTTSSWPASRRRCRRLRVLDPSDESTEMGPLISSGQRASVPGFLDEVEVAFAGSRPDGAGCWFPPTSCRRRPGDPDLARGGLRAGRRGHAVRRRGRRRRHGQRHRVRPLRLDLHQRPRPRRCGSPARVEAGNLSVNSHSSVRYWTPFGGYKQSGLGRELGPDAPMAFTEAKNVFIAHGASWTCRRHDEAHGRTDQDRVAVVTGGARASAWRPYAGSPRRAPRSSSATSTRPGHGSSRTGWRDVATRPRRRHRPGRGRRPVPAAKDTYGSVDIAFNNAGISPPDDDSILDTGLDAWRRVQEVNLTSVYLCCKAALPYMHDRARDRSSTPRRSSR